MSRIEALRYRDPLTRDDDTLPERLIERWHVLRRRGALVGPKGHGKTTLLEALERRLEARGFEVRRLRLRTESPAPDAATRRRLGGGLHARAVISVDGLELLPPLIWWRLRRTWRPVGILATSHRAGRLPTLYQHHTTPELLHRLVRELLEADRFRLVEPCLDGLFLGHGGNVRECLRALYDEFAKPPQADRRCRR